MFRDKKRLESNDVFLDTRTFAELIDLDEKEVKNVCAFTTSLLEDLKIEIENVRMGNKGGHNRMVISYRSNETSFDQRNSSENYILSKFTENFLN